MKPLLNNTKIKSISSSILSKLKYLLLFTTLTLSLNGTSTAEFNKEAYPNFSQMYTNAQTIKKEHNTLGETNSKTEVTPTEAEIASITIGTQIWTASNIALKPRLYNRLGIDYWNNYGVTTPGVKSDEDGFYYTWNAAMNACPSGWHLPSDAEWKVLEGQLGMSVAEQNKTGSRGSNEGKKLKVNGSSGFEAKLAGTRSGSTLMRFIGRGEWVGFWSSTKLGYEAYRRILSKTGNDKDQVYRDKYVETDGNSVRCLKNTPAGAIN